MNNVETLRAGIKSGISSRALALALTEVEARFDAARNSAEMNALKATPPICGKPGRGFKAWRRQWNALREEGDAIYNRNIGHAVHNYTSANDLTYRPSDLANGQHHEMRRSAQDAREAEMSRAREFAATTYTPGDDTVCIADAMRLVSVDQQFLILEA